ncbi:MAG: NAD-dependent epimerase/dehydratase family protein [Planctomycetia bacterium]|nr:NAD-dependent epimerase/dehydratase family protein [Planctomycetia bacterium]
MAGIQRARAEPRSGQIRHLSAQAHEAARRTGATKLLYLGSSCIYPRLATQPITAELRPGATFLTNRPRTTGAAAAPLARLAPIWTPAFSRVSIFAPLAACVRAASRSSGPRNWRLCSMPRNQALAAALDPTGKAASPRLRLR